jgi:hypothetical protein
MFFDVKPCTAALGDIGDEDRYPAAAKARHEETHKQEFYVTD